MPTSTGTVFATSAPFCRFPASIATTPGQGAGTSRAELQYWAGGRTPYGPAFGPTAVAARPSVAHWPGRCPVATSPLVSPVPARPAQWWWPGRHSRSGSAQATNSVDSAPSSPKVWSTDIGPRCSSAGWRVKGRSALRFLVVEDRVDALVEVPAPTLLHVIVLVASGDLGLAPVLSVEEFLLVPRAVGVVTAHHDRSG